MARTKTVRQPKKLPAFRGRQAEADALFSSLGDGAIATDEHGRIRRINQVALDILGFKRKEVIGEWFPKIVPAYNEGGQQIELIDRTLTKAFLTGKPVSAKMFYRTKKGNNLPVFVTVSPVMIEGRPHGAIEVFRDITQEQEVDRMKSEFISIASHQLRTPLSAINMYTHILAAGYKGELKTGQQKVVNTILASVARMNELIDTLLNIARIEQGKLVVNPVDTNLEALVKEVTQEFKLPAQAKEISLRLKVPKEALIIRIDPFLIKEIYANLLSNAVKYTPSGGKVNATLKEEEGRAVFIVKDTGYGIPEGTQHKVFSKFFRAPNIIGEDTTGTGLGLYMVKEIAKATKSEIWFDSQEGKGSTFYYAVPKTKVSKE